MDNVPVLGIADVLDVTWPSAASVVHLVLHCPGLLVLARHFLGVTLLSLVLGVVHLDDVLLHYLDVVILLHLVTDLGSGC